ncbi:MAG: type II secretion system protein GspG [Phycisphaerales bacterium]
MKKNRIHARAFSLLELMLVVAIIAVLSGIVAYSVTAGGEKAKQKATMATLDVVASALKTYNLDNSAYPPAIAALYTAKILDSAKPAKDGWGSDLIYSPQGLNGQEFTLRSVGPDKQSGTPDDIDYWTMNKQGQ